MPRAETVNYGLESLSYIGLSYLVGQYSIPYERDRFY